MLITDFWIIYNIGSRLGKTFCSKKLSGETLMQFFMKERKSQRALLLYLPKIHTHTLVVITCIKRPWGKQSIEGISWPSTQNSMKNTLKQQYLSKF